MSDNPPSYDSVIAAITAQIPANDAKPSDILAAIQAVTPDQAAVIAANTDQTTWNPDAKQQSDFTLGCAKTITSSDSVAHLQQSAADATAACLAIGQVFLNLITELSEIDAKNIPPPEGPFTPRLDPLYQNYRQVVSSSQQLAVEIATYGQRFDAVICPMCTDPTLTTDQRVAKINAFIADAQTFQIEATAMHAQFDKLNTDFAAFVGTFSAWAADKEAADTAQLIQAQQDMSALQEKLGKLKTAMLALGLIAAASLPVTGVIAACLPEFAPLIIIGGLIFAGVTVGATLGLVFAAQAVQSEVDSKQDQINSLTKEIQDIKNTRQKLTDLGSQDLTAFQNAVGTLSGVWTNVQNEAVAIQQWLQQGAEDADMPTYMKVSCDQACTIYETMAVYLTNYANGINAAGMST